MNMDKITIRTEQLKSLAYALESTLIGADGDNREANIRAQNLFYVLFEQIETLSKEVEELAGHVAVCNAIYAVNRVNELKSEIDHLKQERS